jgi:hypothetical protein
MRLASTLALALGLLPAPVSPARAQAPAPPPTWVEDERGRRFRVRFDPADRVFVGTGAVARPTEDGHLDAAVEVGLDRRAPPPPADAEIFWKRDHELVHLRLQAGAGGARVEGRLYRASFLRHARAGLLTIPTATPLRLALPFDVGVRLEVGRLAGPLAPVLGGPALEAGVVRGEAVADFLRSERPGRWLTIGVTAAYDARLARALDGTLRREHFVAPMSAVSASAHTESDSGLFAGGLRAEWGTVWSSRTGWGPRWKAEAALEVTPLALNDRPLSFVLAAAAETAEAGPTVQLSAALRLAF